MGGFFKNYLHTPRIALELDEWGNFKDNLKIYQKNTITTY
jgi:hypothetical protein